ncbi:MAG: 3-isopropylmalate dehydrogenase [Desulfovermiculus sp.]|nr:3-isopropylmalate dehydrogenase [Desulfovermiculus sp.]
MTNSSYQIACIPGDGIGPEVVREGRKILETVGEKFDINFEITEYDLGGERYLRTGDVLPEHILEKLKTYDAILLGAVGHPDVKPGILENGLLLRMRFALDQYINLRPVLLFPGVETPLKGKTPEDIDFVVVRENTEGLYSGSGGFLRKNTINEVAIQESINTRMGVERAVRFAFEYCKSRNKKNKVTLCGKTNVLTFSSDLWMRVFDEVGKEYPDIEKDYGHVDAVCMWMIKSPEFYDVIVTDNIFGDIITDIGAIIQGGLGVAAGGNLNPQGVSMFEPIGGSAPKYAGKNIANPIACINAVQMMLEHLDLSTAASVVEYALHQVVKNDMKGMSAGKMGYTTSEIGDLVNKYILKKS